MAATIHPNTLQEFVEFDQNYHLIIDMQLKNNEKSKKSEDMLGKIKITYNYNLKNVFRHKIIRFFE